MNICDKAVESKAAEYIDGLSSNEIQLIIAQFLNGIKNDIRRLLLIVPDYTRYHSNAGFIANHIYHCIKSRANVDVLIALGTHKPMTAEQCFSMYGDIPYHCFIQHNWRTDTVRRGNVPRGYVRNISEGTLDIPIPIEVNKLIFNDYDAIFSIGQVVPHEVAGMANHAKNIFVGCGGAGMINASHMLGAYFGMERIMGKADTPVRRVFDYAAKACLHDLPLYYLLTVTSSDANSEIITHGLFIGQGKECFYDAVNMAKEKNITLVSKPMSQMVVYLNENEFKSTWLGNKAIYRTRMAIADGGKIIIIAPGLERFGEDHTIDKLIRKYGYAGREAVIRFLNENDDLQNNMSAAAHLIHGSSDNRFSIHYCTRYLSKKEIEGVGYNYISYDEAINRYTIDIPNPSLGLWVEESKL